MLKSCPYLVKTTLAVNAIFYKLIFFGTLVIFLEPAINFRNIWFAKLIITLIMTAQVFFFMFFFLGKDPHHNAGENLVDSS